jgi:site-specific recombinase XerD
LRHGVALEIYEQHRDPEEVRATLGHKRLETTQVYMRIRPQRLKQAAS